MTNTLIIFIVAWLGFIAWSWLKKYSIIESVGGGFIVACLAVIISMPFAPKVSSGEDWRTEDNSIMAYYMMEEFVKKRLKTPTVAKFPGVFDGRSDHIKIIGNQRYAISSYVDSQNSFGAMLRTQFIGEIQQTSENDWVLIRLVLLE